MHIGKRIQEKTGLIWETPYLGWVVISISQLDSNSGLRNLEKKDKKLQIKSSEETTFLVVETIK